MSLDPFSDPAMYVTLHNQIARGHALPPAMRQLGGRRQSQPVLDVVDLGLGAFEVLGVGERSRLPSV